MVEQYSRPSPMQLWIKLYVPGSKVNGPVTFAEKSVTNDLEKQRPLDWRFPNWYAVLIILYFLSKQVESSDQVEST